MDILIPDSIEVVVKTSNKDGVYCKQSSVHIDLNIQGREFPIKFIHERKLYSDFFFHHDFNLVKSNFIFFFKTPAGVWYNYSSLKDLFTFIGYTVDETIFSDLFSKLKEKSKIEEHEVL